RLFGPATVSAPQQHTRALLRAGCPGWWRFTPHAGRSFPASLAGWPLSPATPSACHPRLRRVRRPGASPAREAGSPATHP
ncbi:hypothetical protein FS749_005097, partial [Ceratobasidium sp. UAMH 11750]